MLQSGFDEVLIKPFREKEFLQVLGVTTTDNSTFDLSVIRQMTMGDESLLHSIVDQFIEETQTNLDELEEMIQKKDSSGVREIIHKFSGRTGQLGAMDLSTLFRHIEKELDSGKTVNEVLEKVADSLNQLRLLLIDLQKETLIAS